MRHLGTTFVLSCILVALTASACGGTRNGAPIVGLIADQRTTLGDAIDVDVSISDEDAAGVWLVATADAPALVPGAGLAFLGSGADRTLRIAPAPAGLGTTTITVVARDDAGLEDQVSFDLRVELPFQAPPTERTLADAAAFDRFGAAVDVDGDTALVGAWRVGTKGAVYVLRRDAAGAWTHAATIVADDGASGDGFGISVALDGDTALIGADEVELGRGAAYVFRRDGAGAWAQVARLAADDGFQSDRFGFAVALAGDTAFVGAFGDEDGTGAAYAFERDPAGSWSQRAKLVADDGAEGDFFGVSVDVEEGTALIGANFVDGGRGKVYVYQRDEAANWSPTATLTAPAPASTDSFGYALALDGDAALVGALGTNGLTGAAYAYRRGGTGAWLHDGTLVADDGASGAWFGYSVAVSDGSAIVGAIGAGGAFTGAAYAFRRTGVGTWTQTLAAVLDGAAAADRFGYDVAIDGATALVGADGRNSAAGAAYFFVK